MSNIDLSAKPILAKEEPPGSGEFVPASVADLLAALLNEGGEIVETAPVAGPDPEKRAILVDPGRYLVVPLEDE